MFRLATVREPRKPYIDEAAARRTYYLLSSAFHATLKTNRVATNPRGAMIASANTFRTSNVLYIANASTLKGLFPGFGRIDDYLRLRQGNASKTGLKSLIEGPDVLNQSAADYVAGPGYVDLKSRVWDNVFALTILGDDSPLRTEEVRMLRLLNVIEKIATDDPLMDTGPGIFSVYMSIVLLPDDVFPMPDVALPPEPTTRPEPDDHLKDLRDKLNALQKAYAEVNEAYGQQGYENRTLHYPKRDENDPDDSLQKNLLDHDPLALSKSRGGALSSKTHTELSAFGIKEDFVYMPYVHDKFGGEIRRWSMRHGNAGPLCVWVAPSSCWATNAYTKNPTARASPTTSRNGPAEPGMCGPSASPT